MIEAPIGEGASAIVYRARDIKHDRGVAVKVLRTESTDEASRQRFAREIAVIAKLRHPNILPLFDSGVTPDGTAFYVMPLVQGKSLRSRLWDGALPVEEAVLLAGEVADALAFAHAAGVVHRDVKPENIYVEGGCVNA